MLFTDAHSSHATKRACNRTTGNLTRCADTCDFAREIGEPRFAKRLMAACKAANAQAPAITVSRSVLLLANEQDHAIHIGSPLHMQQVGPSLDGIR